MKFRCLVRCISIQPERAGNCCIFWREQRRWVYALKLVVEVNRPNPPLRPPCAHPRPYVHAPTANPGNAEFIGFRPLNIP